MQFSMQIVLGLVFIAAFAIDTGLTQCPSGFGCFRYPAGCGDTGAAMCDMLVTWKANDAAGIEISLTGKNSGTDPRWMAIGFSTDTTMDEDDILLCRQTTDTAVVVLEHYWSVKSAAGVQAIVDETSADITMDGLTNVTNAFQNGYVTCRFTRAVSVANKPHIYNLAETTAADMMPKYNFFFGHGPVSSNTPLQHEVNPHHSSAGVDYTVTGEITSEIGSSEEDSDSHEGAATNTIATMLLMMMTCLAIFMK